MRERMCPLGLTRDELRERLGNELATFDKWMYGQTGAICDGRKYNHEDQTYHPTPCRGNEHGVVVYSWDLNRYLSGGKVVD